MPVWIDYWQERAERAEYLAVRVAQLLDDCHRCNDVRALQRQRIQQYRQGMVRNRGWLATGEWSELAGIIEEDLDRLAALLQAHFGYHYPSMTQYRECEYLIGAWKQSIAVRHAPLPAGPTLIGHLASGGIEV
jgi:hypothetical protein